MLMMTMLLLLLLLLWLLWLLLLRRDGQVVNKHDISREVMLNYR